MTAIAHDDMAAHQASPPTGFHPVEVSATDRHLAEWIAKRLGRDLRIPDLSALNFTLLGGRILPAGQNIAAQLT
jgi:anti-sigma factor RsiW